MEKDILNTQETAKMLGVSRSYVYIFVREGKLRPIQVQTILKRPHLKFRRSEVERFLQQEMAAA